MTSGAANSRRRFVPVACTSLYVGAIHNETLPKTAAHRSPPFHSQKAWYLFLRLRRESGKFKYEYVGQPAAVGTDGRCLKRARGSREHCGLGPATDVHVPARIDGNAFAAVSAVTAAARPDAAPDMRGIDQSRALRVDRGHEGVPPTRPISSLVWLESVRSRREVV